jgi:hypothetical protein
MVRRKPADCAGMFRSFVRSDRIRRRTSDVALFPLVHRELNHSGLDVGFRSNASGAHDCSHG